MKKLTAITKKVLMNTIAEENLGEFIDDTKNIIKEPNKMAIGKTKAGNFIVYETKENGKMKNMSVHPTHQLAWGMMLRRLREQAANA